MGVGKYNYYLVYLDLLHGHRYLQREQRIEVDRGGPHVVPEATSRVTQVAAIAG
jgi:hypothetical protein